MKSREIVLLALAVLFFHTGGFWSATWLSKWALLLAVSSGVVSLWAARRTSYWHLPLMLYAFGSLLYLGAWPQSPYQQTMDAVTLLALQKNALYGILALMACLLLSASIDRRSRPGCIVALSLVWFFGVAGTLLLPGTGPTSPPNNGMWFGNPSMGASLLACLLPCVWVWRYPRSRVVFRIVTWLFTLWAISRTHASVPWGVLGVVTAAFLVAKMFKKDPFLVPVVVGLLALCMMFAGNFLLGAEFWDQNGRFEIWGMAWDWFRAHGSLATGMGFSSSQTLIPLEQTITGHYHGSYFLWLHNDWLQLFIEGGVLGGLCVALSLGRLLWKSYAGSRLFSSLCGFITLGLFNYPLRLPIHAFCLCLLIGLIESQ